MERLFKIKTKKTICPFVTNFPHSTNINNLLSVLVNGHPRPMEHDTVREFRKELAHIRDRINFLFDRLEFAETEAKKASVTQVQTAPKPVQPAPAVEKGICVIIIYLGPVHMVLIGVMDISLCCQPACLPRPYEQSLILVISPAILKENL